MLSEPSLEGSLTLGHLLHAAGLQPTHVVAIRHTLAEGGFRSGDGLAPDEVLEYTRWQPVKNKLGAQPPALWLVFMADGQRRARLFATYENRGMRLVEREGAQRRFDLHPSNALAALVGRLVVDWSKDTVTWAKPGVSAAAFPVIEIADPGRIAFPGFDRVLLTYAELQLMVSDSRYVDWQTALGAVQGVYLIADRVSGRLYVGKADGKERILGRWSSYARGGHGGNAAMRQLETRDPNFARQFQFSLLRVFGPSVPSAEVDAAESHFKRALLSRTHGLNLN